MLGFLWRLLLMEGLLVGIYFGAAGRWDLPWGWALFAVHASLLTLMMSLADPELRQERFRPGPGAKDPHIRKLLIPFVLAHLIVAGLDAGRFGWSGEMPTMARAVAMSLYVFGMGVSVWAMAVNRFFSPVVRHQTDRGHVVITGGPYRFIRHPGYAGVLLSAFSGGIVLGSWWSWLPLIPVLAILWMRIRMEDRFLHEVLEGYSEYSGRVRYRLCPGVW